MRRRDFITLLDSAAAAWPLTARAQQEGGAKRIGILVARLDDMISVPLTVLARPNEISE